MIIQKILPPHKNQKSLYYKELDSLRRDKPFIGNARIDNTFPIYLNKGDVISFETYVNALSIEKWMRYTKVKDNSIKLRIKGDANIQVYNSVGVYDSVSNTRAAGRHELDVDIECHEVRDYNEYTIGIPDSNLQGVVYPVIEAINECSFIGGEYITSTSEGVREIKPAFIINYNNDAITTQKTINAIYNQLNDVSAPIIVCDMTSSLKERTFEDVINGEFIDNSQENCIIKQIATSKRVGDSYNKAIKYLLNESCEDYTHAILIESGVLLNSEILDRVTSFLSLLDDIRSDMMIQGDIIEDDSHLVDSGYVMSSDKECVRFNGFNLTKPDDFVSLVAAEELDFFKLGLICIPLGLALKGNDKKVDYKLLNPDIEECVELDYYLHKEKLNITSLNGFFGYKKSNTLRGLVWDYYYKYRDRFIAIVGSNLEMDRQEFRFFIEKEINKEKRKGNIELAFAILEAANDFLNGPEGLYDEYCLEEIRDRLKELTQRFNDSIVGRKNLIKDRLELQKFYNKICLKIDHDYDMIIDKWTESKRKVDDEREQQ